MDLLDLVKSQLSEQLIEGLASQVGIGNKEQTQNATLAAASTLINALSRNASTETGASALSGALERDHDGSILNDLAGLLLNQGQSTQAAQPSMLNGAGILKHVLGGKQNDVISMIAKMAGLDQNASASLLTKIAPLVMGVLGQQQKQQSLDPSGLAALLNQNREQIQKKDAGMSIFEKILDQDGDGSIADDAANIGMKILGGLFKK